MPNFSLEMRKKRGKTAIILWESLLQGIHNDAVLAGDNFFKKSFYNVTEHFAGGL
jgi:hypothetical protein